jgi:hypothetical protein
MKTGTARHLATTVCIALGCLQAVHGVAAAQTPVEGWSGQLQCQIASRGVGYQDDQTHTWVLSGAPGVRNDFRDYPATWTVSGNGRRAPISARASAAGAGDSWTYGGSNASASITLYVPGGTTTIRITAGQRAVTATSGIRGTAASVPFAVDVNEWRFQYIDVVNGATRATLSDSRTHTRSDLVGWRPPPGTTVAETCSWNLTRSGSGSAGGADAKGAAAAAGAGGARGAVITGGAAPAGGAAGGSAAGAARIGGTAGAASGNVAGAGAPSKSGASANPPGGAANNGTTAGDSSTALNPDVTRQYTAIGLTPTPGTGVVVATLVDDTGAPLVGVSVADIRLLDATSLPVGMGPYMFGTTGDIVDSNTLSVTASFNGRSRVAFLDAPVGRLTLTVIYSRDGKVVTRSAQVVTTAGGVTAVQP